MNWSGVSYMDTLNTFERLGKILEITLFEINQTPVTISSILMFILMITIFYISSRFINRLMMKPLLGRFSIDDGIRYNLIRINHYLIMVIGIIVSFQFIGIDLSGLAVIFGLLSVGIGFGLQNVTSNFISGLILLFERPIKIGDRVTVGDTEGDVIDINIRSTTIRTLNNITFIVPNSEFVSSRVINWSHGDTKIRLQIAVGVSYKSDLDIVLKALQEVAEEHQGVLKKPKSDVLFNDFGDSSWNMMLRVWIQDPKKHPIIHSELNCAIVRKFREYGIEIPYPQRDLHLKNSDNNELKNSGLTKN
jgi:small-conductance mechanosensitive channel